MVRKFQLVLIIAGVLGLALIGPFSASAENNSGSELNAPVSAQAAATGQSVATVGGHVRLVAIIKPGGGVLRSLGVSQVTNPSTGVYCIKPSGPFDVTKVVASVTPEDQYSSGHSLLAYFAATNFTCPAKTLEVHTYDLAGSLNNYVAFTIIVP
ncbi:MAG: hypothetical protein P4L55_12965 [Syntrophobacteraceae bacterium]|nr:hypothetical protein [Syntrophobacteraceae bacterium]